MGFDLRFLTSELVFFPHPYSADTDTQLRKTGLSGQAVLHWESRGGHTGLGHWLLPIWGHRAPDWGPALGKRREQEATGECPRAALGIGSRAETEATRHRECVEGGKVVGFQLDEILAGSLRNLIKNQIGPELWE